MTADTRHLDAAIDILRSDKGKRAKPQSTFVMTDCGTYAILQGPRGKTVKTFLPPDGPFHEQAEKYVAGIPGATLTIY